MLYICMQAKTESAAAGNTAYLLQLKHKEPYFADLWLQDDVLLYTREDTVVFAAKQAGQEKTVSLIYELERKQHCGSLIAYQELRNVQCHPEGWGNPLGRPKAEVRVEGGVPWHLPCLGPNTRHS